MFTQDLEHLCWVGMFNFKTREIMINKNIKNFFLGFVCLFSLASCFSDLDTTPIDEDVVTSELVFENTDSYEQVLAKLYSGLAVSGQQGPAGQADIEGIDEGFGQYLRALWYHQEFPTDEALVGWNDQTIGDFHDQDWSATDGFIFAFYSRIFYQISACNEFLRETTSEKLSERGHESVANEIEAYRQEARFLRALSYWHALDHFRNVPFVTEEDAVGQFFPNQIQGNDLFDYLEGELLEIENTIAPVRSNAYARADQGAVWALLAKLYMNAEVYTGVSKWNECLEYCNNLINAGYQLDEEYEHLFLADNHNSNEIIFPIAFDGVNTRTWGGMTFIIRAAIGGLMDPLDSGVSGGWGGVRTTKQLVNNFGDIGGVIITPSMGNTVQYPKIYTPGSFQGYDYSDTNNALSSVDSDMRYEGYKYFPDPNGTFRIATIPSESAPYFGDNDGDGTLEQFGDDILVAEPGLYKINVDLNDDTYTLEKTEWGVIGDAIGSWDTDVDMTWDADLGALVANITAVEGEFKFRANDSWDLELGDNGADSVLEYGGANISIPQGDYEVILFINRPDYSLQVRLTSFDRRPFFFSDGQSLEIEDIAQFTNGYAVNKFKNITSAGLIGSDTDFPDTDFPLFRLADFRLMAAEAILRSGGSASEAADHFNAVRERAYKGTAGNVTAAALNLDLILEERARELYWECHRRTDLVRFGQFTDGEYVWAWKGGVMEGQSVPSFRDIYPIPAADIGANPNLDQNDGY